MGKVEAVADKIEYSQMTNHFSTVCNLSAALEYGMPHKEVALEMEHFYYDEDMEFHISSAMRIWSSPGYLDE